jgi:hypothetical protein
LKKGERKRKKGGNKKRKWEVKGYRTINAKSKKLRQKGHNLSRKMTCCERGKISFLEGGKIKYRLKIKLYLIPLDLCLTRRLLETFSATIIGPERGMGINIVFG